MNLAEACTKPIQSCSGIRSLKLYPFIPRTKLRNTRWWEQLSYKRVGSMVVKPMAFASKGKWGLAQPAMNCWAAECLHIIFGPENTDRLKKGAFSRRGLSPFGSLRWDCSDFSVLRSESPSNGYMSLLSQNSLSWASQAIQGYDLAPASAPSCMSCMVEPSTPNRTLTFVSCRLPVQILYSFVS